MASLSAVRVKRKISCQYNVNVCHIMMPGHGANPIFFSGKNKDLTSATLTDSPLPPRLITSHNAPPPSKWTSYMHIPYIIVNKMSINHKICCLRLKRNCIYLKVNIELRDIIRDATILYSNNMLNIYH